MKKLTIILTVLIAMTVSTKAQNSDSSPLPFNRDSNTVTVRIDKVSDAGYTVNIYNSKEVLVKSEKIKKNKMQINVEDLVDGFYRFEIIPNEGIQWKFNHGLLIQR